MASERRTSNAGKDGLDLHMSKGDSDESYSKNSNVQQRLIEKAVIPNLSAALAHLHLMESQNRVTLADLGCSSGPNAILLMSRLVEKIQQNFASRAQPSLEFQAFFNDLPSNDFNNLFQLLSSGDVKRPNFYSAGVPGSFFGPLFPDSTVHVFVSASAAHYLSKIPASALEKDSPAFNKGAWWAIGNGSNIEADDAFRDQYAEDLDRFIKLRAKELVPGGLLCFAICSRWNPESNNVRTSMDTAFKCSETALKQLVEQGVISEDKADFFNIPIYFPDTAWLEDQILKHQSILELVVFKEMRVKPFVEGNEVSQSAAQEEAIRSSASMTRGALTDMVHRQLGPEATQLFFEQCGKETMAHAEGLSQDTAIAFVALKKRLASNP